MQLGRQKGQGSRSQVRWELVFGSAGGASRRIDDDALRRSHVCGDDGAAIAAQIIRVAGAAEQRFAPFGRNLIGGSGRRARDLQGCARHRAWFLTIGPAGLRVQHVRGHPAGSSRGIGRLRTPRAAG